MQQFINEVMSRLDPIIVGLPRAIVMVLLVWIAYFLASRALMLLDGQRKVSPVAASFIRRVLRWGALVLAVVLALQAFGLLENAWAAITAVLAMIAIGFVAVWSVMSNALCSLIILIVRPFEIGDTLEFPPDNLKGKVVNFSLLFTTLRTEDDRLLQIPNNMFFQRVICRTRGEGPIDLDDQLLREKDARI
ncbi:MAG: mechanosensitive ion channel [Planctomycetota bacterium]|nr:mechanosensitive ion channel [Planctomycetota bacterium]